MAKVPKKKQKKKQTAPLEMGWREYVALPLLDVPKIKVKVDTGARTSALHVSDVRYVKRRGKTFVKFVVHPKQKTLRPAVACEAELLEYRVVRSSNGARSVRPVIQTDIQVGERLWSIELTLVNRDHMGFRMLLGRNGVLPGLRVNPHRSYIQRKRARE